MSEKIRLADFISYTDDIFPGIKNFKGECVKGEELYYLSESHALFDYVKKIKDGYTVGFSDENFNMLIDKIKYFLYPDNRKEKFKKDIEVEEFSTLCAFMFYKRFGFDFDILRIKSDKNNERFKAEQKMCIVELYSRCIKGLQRFSDAGGVNKEVFELILKSFHQDCCFRLAKVDVKYLFENYTPYLKTEVLSYISAFNNSFQIIKKFYPQEEYNYLMGVEEQKNQISQSVKEQLMFIRNTIKLVLKLKDAKSKIDIENTIKSFRINELKPRDFFDFYEELVCDKNDLWKSALINNWIENTVFVFSDINEAAIEYVMINDKYETLYMKYYKFADKISEYHNDDSYWKLATLELLKFENAVFNTLFTIAIQFVLNME